MRRVAVKLNNVAPVVPKRFWDPVTYKNTQRLPDREWSSRDDARIIAKDRPPDEELARELHRTVKAIESRRALVRQKLKTAKRRKIRTEAANFFRATGRRPKK